MVDHYTLGGLIDISMGYIAYWMLVQYLCIFKQVGCRFNCVFIIKFKCKWKGV